MRICFVGDSFVNGTGDPTYLGWTGRLCVALRQEGYDITYYNLGVRRETSADIKARWLREVSSRLITEEACRLVFSFGVNDTTVEGNNCCVKFEDSSQNAHEILKAASQLAPVLMVSPLPIADEEQNLRTERLGHGFTSVCDRLSIPFLNVFTPLQSSEVWRREVVENDGAHPLAEGYAELAQLVKEQFSWGDWLC